MGTHSSTSKRLVVGLLIGLAVAVGLGIMGARAPRGTATEEAVRATPPSGEPGPPSAVRAASAEPPSGTVEAHVPTPEEVIEEVLKKDKKLGLFMEYHRTVLLDGQRRDEYRKLLSDADMMKAMADGLMDPGKGDVGPEEHYHRLMLIDYFDAALNWKNNPEREHVLAVTGDIVSKDNFTSEQNTDRRQMLAGGKMELYRLMYEQDPAKTQQLASRAKGTRMESLVSWMSDEELRRRAREEQIRVEMEKLQASAN